MNTIGGLKALPGIIQQYESEIEQLKYKMAQCQKPIKDIIQAVFRDQMGWAYIDDIEIGNNVHFVIRYHSDDECEGTYNYPLEAFISAETLLNHIVDENEKKAKAAIALKEEEGRKAQKNVEVWEREQYERLKKKYEGA